MADYSIYPIAIDGYAQLPLQVDKKSPVNAESVNRLRSAIVNIENTLGIAPQNSQKYGVFTNVNARVTNIENLLDGGGGTTGVSIQSFALFYNQTELPDPNGDPFSNYVFTTGLSDAKSATAPSGVPYFLSIKSVETFDNAASDNNSLGSSYFQENPWYSNSLTVGMDSTYDNESSSGLISTGYTSAGYLYPLTIPDQASKKYYYIEVQYNKVTGADTLFGIIPLEDPFDLIRQDFRMNKGGAANIEPSIDGITYSSSGTVYSPYPGPSGTNITGLDPLTDGDILGVLVEHNDPALFDIFSLSSGFELRVYFSVNGVWQNGDPAVGNGTILSVSPFSFFRLATSLYSHSRAAGILEVTGIPASGTWIKLRDTSDVGADSYEILGINADYTSTFLVSDSIGAGDNNATINLSIGSPATNLVLTAKSAAPGVDEYLIVPGNAASTASNIVAAINNVANSWTALVEAYIDQTNPKMVVCRSKTLTIAGGDQATLTTTSSNITLDIIAGRINMGFPANSAAAFNLIEQALYNGKRIGRNVENSSPEIPYGRKLGYVVGLLDSQASTYPTYQGTDGSELYIFSYLNESAGNVIEVTTNSGAINAPGQFTNGDTYPELEIKPASSSWTYTPSVEVDEWPNGDISGVPLLIGGPYGTLGNSIPAPFDIQSDVAVPISVTGIGRSIRIYFSNYVGSAIELDIIRSDLPHYVSAKNPVTRIADPAEIFGGSPPYTGTYDIEIPVLKIARISVDSYTSGEARIGLGDLYSPPQIPTSIEDGVLFPSPLVSEIPPYFLIFSAGEGEIVVSPEIAGEDSNMINLYTNTVGPIYPPNFGNYVRSLNSFWAHYLVTNK